MCNYSTIGLLQVPNGMELMTTLFIDFLKLNVYSLYDVEVTFADKDPKALGKNGPLCVSNN